MCANIFTFLTPNFYCYYFLFEDHDIEHRRSLHCWRHFKELSCSENMKRKKKKQELASLHGHRSAIKDVWALTLSY